MARIISRTRTTTFSTGLTVVLLLLCAGSSQAADPFIYRGEPIHPGCVHALAMNAGDEIPVTTSISLVGCSRSDRSRAELIFDDEIVSIKDEVLLGEGTFGYRHLSTLKNGLFVLGIRRVLPDGSEHISLAAVALVDRPVLRAKKVRKQPVLEMIGEVWIPDMHMARVSSQGNVVYYSAGEGALHVEDTVDLSAIGRAVK